MCFCIRPWGCFRYACLKSTLCMLLHLSALIALMRGLSMSPPRCPCPVFCIYLSVEACLSPSLPFAVFALRLVGYDNVCCSSLVLSITAGSTRFPAVNSQSIYVPFGLVNSKKKNTGVWGSAHLIRVWGLFWQCALRGSLGVPVGHFYSDSCLRLLQF